MAFNVTALAAYTKANETQLLTKALFGAKSISLLTPQIGVKSTQQVNTMDTDAVFQADACGWSARIDSTCLSWSLPMPYTSNKKAEVSSMNLSLSQASRKD